MDPLPFVAPPAAADQLPRLGFAVEEGARLARRVGSGALRLAAKQYLRPRALVDNRSVLELSDGRRLVLSNARLEPQRERIERLTVGSSGALRAGEAEGAPAIADLRAGDRLEVLANGEAGGRLVRTTDGLRGWY